MGAYGQNPSIQLPIIPSTVKHSSEIGLKYSENIQGSKSEKDRFVEQLKILAQGLEDIELSIRPSANPSLILYRKNQDAAIPLAMYGDGTIKLARLLMELQIWSGQRLMIDEIDTGIYYKRMPDFWRTLINGADSNQVQLFATTHNKECLDAFANLFQEKEFAQLKKKARVLKMTRLPDGQVRVFPYEFDQFQYAMEVEYEIR